MIERLGRYEIIKELGRGGMGVVYQAFDRRLSRTVAIKTIKFAEANSSQHQIQIDADRERLFREAEAAGCLSHRHIVTIHDVGEDAGVAYIVMEFVDGLNLEELSKKSPLSVKRVLEILGCAAEALDYAHSKSIIHRDVKPANIMVQEDETVKLADFGVARLLNAEGMTPSGNVMGSPHFVAPELLLNETPSKLSDQFSLAVTTYQVLTGRMPFEAENIHALLTKIASQAPPPSGLIEAADLVLRKALSKDPAARYKNCRDFVTALKAALLHREDEPTVTMVSLPRFDVAVRAFEVANKAKDAALFDEFAKHFPDHELAKLAKIEAAALRRTTAPKPTPALQTRVNPKDGLTYIYIPPGTFHMGCSPGDKEAYKDEKPSRQVTLTKGFWMAESPITQAAYEHVMGKNPSHFEGSNRPVETVTWLEAVEYCKKAGVRLPTEAEWEYAARGKSDAARYGKLDDIAWYGENSGSTTHDVKEKLPNAYGLYDMLGNVWEWTEDWYVEKLGGNPVTDPVGPPKGEVKALRGGSWYYDARYPRASGRGRYVPAAHGSTVGFRCVGD